MSTWEMPFLEHHPLPITDENNDRQIYQLLITPRHLNLTVELSNLERADSSRRANTLVRQGSLALSASSTNTVHANIFDTITQDNRLSTTRSLDVEVLELDVLADSVLAV